MSEGMLCMIARQIFEDVAAAVDRGRNAIHLAAKCYADDGALLGTHYAPLRLALALTDGDRLLDLASDEAGGAIPIETSVIARVTVEEI